MRGFLKLSSTHPRPRTRHFALITFPLPSATVPPIPSIVTMLGIATASRAGNLRGGRSRQGLPGRGMACSMLQRRSGGIPRVHPLGSGRAAGGGPEAGGTPAVQSSLHNQRLHVPPRGDLAVGVLRARSEDPALPVVHILAPISGYCVPGGECATRMPHMSLATVFAWMAFRPRVSWSNTTPALLSDWRASMNKNQKPPLTVAHSMRPEESAAAALRLAQPCLVSKSRPSVARGGGDDDGGMREDGRRRGSQ